MLNKDITGVLPSINTVNNLYIRDYIPQIVSLNIPNAVREDPEEAIMPIVLFVERSDTS